MKTTTPHRMTVFNIWMPIIAFLLSTIIGCTTAKYGCKETQRMSGYHPLNKR